MATTDSTRGSLLLASDSRPFTDAGLALLRCPACAAAEPVSAADLAAGLRRIACQGCGARFPGQEPPLSRREAGRSAPPGAVSGPPAADPFASRPSRASASLIIEAQAETGRPAVARRAAR